VITFRVLRWRNFLSTGNQFTEVVLDSHRTTLIVGENGAGKSTILDALSFVLFGKAFRKINKPQLLNSITQKNLTVEVEFSIGHNQYKIIRGIKPSVFEVYQNGNLLNQSAESRDYQEILEKQILKVNHKSFCQVVVLGSATFQPFMQLSSGQRREIIEDLLDLQIFTTMNVLLKDKISFNIESISSSNNEKRLIEEKIKIIKQHLIQIQNSNEQLIEDKKQRIAETNNAITLLNDEYSTLKDNLSKQENDIGDDKSVSKRLNKLSQLRHQIEAKRSVINKDIKFFKDHEGCPTCKQVIDQGFKEKTIEERTSEIVKIDDALQKLIQQYDETNEQLNQIIQMQSNINDQKIEIHRKKTKITSLMDYCDQLQDEIKSITKSNKNVDTSNITDLEKEKIGIEKKLESLIDDRNVMNAASVLLKDTGIKSRIIKQYIPIINKLINKYLSSMEFMCQFELDETFNETIKSRYRDEFSYSSFSEGEKMRINLAILFAWRSIAKMRNSINTNILIMDEVFDSSLDSNGTEEFIRIINDLTSDTNTFIISHKTDQLYDKFERVLKFEKHRNFSRII